MSEMSSAEVIAEGWDEVKALAHLADLRERQTIERAIFDALTAAAEEHDRAADNLGRQIAHCVQMFSKPRPTQPTSTQEPADD